jgi:hypothetical protein
MPPEEPGPGVPAPPGQRRAPGDPAPVRLASRWVGPLYLLLAVCLLPWSVYIAWSLPSRSASSSWDVAWAGFDAGLVAALAATGWAAWRRAWWVQAAATATATLLVVDVWFDVVTASGGGAGGGDRGGSAGGAPPGGAVAVHRMARLGGQFPPASGPLARPPTEEPAIGEVAPPVSPVWPQRWTWGCRPSPGERSAPGAGQHPGRPHLRPGCQPAGQCRPQPAGLPQDDRP